MSKRVTYLNNEGLKGSLLPRNDVYAFTDTHGAIIYLIWLNFTIEFSPKKSDGSCLYGYFIRPVKEQNKRIVPFL